MGLMFDAAFLGSLPWVSRNNLIYCCLPTVEQTPKLPLFFDTGDSEGPHQTYMTYDNNM